MQEHQPLKYSPLPYLRKRIRSFRRVSFQTSPHFTGRQPVIRGESFSIRSSGTELSMRDQSLATISSESQMMRPQFLVSVASTSLPPPALTLALSHTPLLCASAAFTRSSHSCFERTPSRTTAYRPLYWGSGVFVKSILVTVRAGAGPLSRSDAGLAGPTDAMSPICNSCYEMDGPEGRLYRCERRCVVCSASRDRCGQPALLPISAVRLY